MTRLRDDDPRFEFRRMQDYGLILKRADRLWGSLGLLLIRRRILSMCMKFATHVHLMRKLQTSRDLPVFVCMLSWCGQGQIYLSLDNFYCFTVHFDNTEILITNKCTSFLHI